MARYFDELVDGVPEIKKLFHEVVSVAEGSKPGREMLLHGILGRAAKIVGPSSGRHGVLASQEALDLVTEGLLHAFVVIEADVIEKKIPCAADDLMARAKSRS